MATEEELLKTAKTGVIALVKNSSPEATASGGKWNPVKADASVRLNIFDNSSTPGTNVKLYKAVIEIPYNLETVFAVILDLKSRLKWDGNIAALEGTDLKIVDGPELCGWKPKYQIFRSATKQVGPISGRDFVDVVYIGQMDLLPADIKSAAPAGLQPGTILNGGSGLSAGHPAYPEASGFVRGFNFPGCGWVIEPLQGPTDTSAGAAPVPANSNGWTRIHYIVQSDLKGWLPSAVVNASMVGMFESFFAALLKYMAGR